MFLVANVFQFVGHISLAPEGLRLRKKTVGYVDLTVRNLLLVTLGVPEGQIVSDEVIKFMEDSAELSRSYSYEADVRKPIVKEIFDDQCRWISVYATTPTIMQKYARERRELLNSLPHADGRFDLAVKYAKSVAKGSKLRHRGRNLMNSYNQPSVVGESEARTSEAPSGTITTLAPAVARADNPGLVELIRQYAEPFLPTNWK